MRTRILAVLIPTFVVGVGVETVAAQSVFSSRVSTILRANGGSACAKTKAGQSYCLVKKATKKAVRTGETVSSPAALQICSGGTKGCQPVTKAGTYAYCQGLATCVPLAASCPSEWEFSCAPVADPTPGAEIACACSNPK
jgi:hypothetical protein